MKDTAKKEDSKIIRVDTERKEKREKKKTHTHIQIELSPRK